MLLYVGLSVVFITINPLRAEPLNTDEKDWVLLEGCPALLIAGEHGRE